MATRRTAVLVTLLLATLTHALRRGDWRQLSKSGSLYKLVNRRYAFPVRGNLNYCGRRTITVPLDGRRDYTAIFNEKMKLLNRLGGGTLKLNRGVYTHSDSIHIPSYVCLVGDGMYRTTIKLNSYAKRFKYAGSIRSFETERISVMHMTIDGNRFNQFKNKRTLYGRYGFFSELTNWLYLYRVRVIRHEGYGFDPHGSKKYWAYYLVVDDCRAERNGLDGFTIDQTVHASITRGISTANDRHGYNIVTGTQLAVFANNRAVNNGFGTRVGFGIVAQNNENFGTKSITFRKCTTQGDFRGGLRLRDVNNIYVENCNFEAGPRGVCYELSKTYLVFLRSNRCVVSMPSRLRKLAPGTKLVESGTTVVIRRRPAAPRPRTPLPNGRADPVCGTGKRFSNVCCASQCKSCGRLGCGRNVNGPGASFCCVTGIRTTKRSCATSPPPCVMPAFL